MKKYFAIAVLGMLAITSCKEKKEAVEEPKKFVLSDSMQHMIALDSVSLCNIADEISLSGEIDFNENSIVKIFPRSSGQVIESRVSLGDKVSKGQVLAVIRSADVAGNYSDLNSANADLAIAKRQMDNAESLYKNGISSEREYTEAKQGYEKALAAKNKVQSLININSGGGSNAGGQYTLVSPIDGYIVEKKLAAGSFIRPDMGDYLYTISNLKDVWVNANVYAQDIPKVKEGYKVKVVALSYPDKVFTGTVDKVSEVLDPQSKALRARITLDNKDLMLKPDMYVRVVVTNEENAKATCIPTSAVITRDSRNYVVIYKNKDDMRVAEVNVMKTVGDRTFISSGATRGQMVVTKFQNLIFERLTDD